MSAVAEPRFVVRELEGYATARKGTGNGIVPGLTMWVADEAYNGREIKIWRSEVKGNMPRADRRALMRSDAIAFAAELNRSDQDETEARAP